MSKLKEMLEYVSTHNEYYRNIIRKHNIVDTTDISKYPIITRQQLQDNRYNMFSDGGAEKYYSKKLTRTHTSGSSGEPVNIYWDENDYNYTCKLLWKMRHNYYGIKPSSKKVRFFGGVIEEGSQLITINNNTMSISQLLFNDRNAMDTISKEMMKFSPEWISISPCILEILCDYYEKTTCDIPSSLKLIESVGEVLTNELKKRSEKIFNVPVKNLYGTEEVRTIAYECPFGHMHLLSDNVYIELLSIDGQHISSTQTEGITVITSLTNKIMPIIRYNQGDYIEITNKINCPCGNCSPIITDIKGRVNNIFIINGQRIDGHLLKDIVEKTNNYFADPICKYRFEYHTTSNCLYGYLQLTNSFSQWRTVIENFFVDEFFSITGLSKSSINISFYFDDVNYWTNNKNQILRIIE